MPSGIPLTEDEKRLISSGFFSAKDISAITNLNEEVIAKRAKLLGVKLPNARDKHLCDQSFFSSWSKSMAYWLGFIMADGNVSGNRLTLSIKYSDRGHLEKFKSILRATQTITKYGPKKYPQVKLRISSGQICKDLNKYGIVEQKSLTVQMPADIPETHIQDFIRGYFDGDGSITIRTERVIVVVLGTPSMLEAIKEYFSSFYGKEIGSISRHNQTRIYRYYVHGNLSGRAFLRWLYDDSDFYTRLERKYHLYKEACH